MAVIARSVSDEAIQSRVRDSGLLRFARNDDRKSPAFAETTAEVVANYSAAVTVSGTLPPLP
jgi:hypothetical protein